MFRQSQSHGADCYLINTHSSSFSSTPNDWSSQSDLNTPIATLSSICLIAAPTLLSLHLRVSWQVKRSKICSALTSTLTHSTPLLSPTHPALTQAGDSWVSLPFDGLLITGLHHSRSVLPCSDAREGGSAVFCVGPTSHPFLLLPQNKTTSGPSLFCICSSFSAFYPSFTVSLIIQSRSHLYIF